MIGEALAVACGDRAVLSRIAGPLGEAARAAAAELARLDPAAAQRSRRLAWAAAARAAVPPGIRGVHPSWIEAGLDGLPRRARDDVARGGGDPAAVWLARAACAALPPLPAADLDGPPRSLDEAIRLRGVALASWLVELGVDQLALALGGAGRDAGVRLVGERLVHAAERIARPPRLGALGPLRAAVARASLAAPYDDPGLAVIGARAIAAHVGALAACQLAVRLPRPLGLAVRAELLAHAGTPIDHAPTWRALAAPY